MAVTDFYVTLTENSYNVANNTSSVTARVYITTTNSYNRLGTANGNISFGGNASGSFNFSATFTTYQTKQIYSRTFTVKHNADGSGSVSCSVWFNTRVSAGTVRDSASLTLHKIPRASTPSVSGTLELGKEITLTMNRASSNYTHTVRWSWAGQSGTIGTGIGASTKWTPQVGLASYLTNAASAQCTLTTTTYNGSSVIGTTTKMFKLSIPSTMVPTISSVSVEDTEGFLGNYEAFVTGLSKPKVTITAASVYGATIASYKVDFGSQSATGNPAVFQTFDYAGNLVDTVDLVVTVTDTRGRTATWKQAYTVAFYYLDSLKTILARRWDVTNDEEDDESTTIRVNAAGNLFQVNGKGTSSGSIKVEMKERSSTQYITAYNQVISTTFNLIFDIADCDNTKIYDIRVTVSDEFGNSRSTDVVVSTAKPIMDFKSNGKGLSFFGISRFDGIHFNGDVTLTSADGTGAKLLGFSGQETPYPLIHTYPQAGYPEGAPNLRIGGTTNDLYEVERINALELYWDAYLSGDIGYPLRTGPWSSGTVNVPDSMKYRMFLIFFGTSGSVEAPAVIAVKDWMNSTSGVITGIGGQTGVASNANSQNIYSVNISYDEDSWTLNRASYVTHGTTSPYTHSAGQTRPIWQIRGLL